MKNFKGKVAVITGGANGIGRAIADECNLREIKIVLGDIDREGLKKAEADLNAKGAEVLTVEMDVTKYEDMERLAQKALERFGHVDLLFNNAGIAIPGPTWMISMNDWEWIVRTNLMGNVHGLKVFIPIMLKQDTECHIVDTASVAGLLTSPGMPSYHTTKFASVALAESTYIDLQAVTSKIKMSVYCPGFIQTDLDNCERHRPERYKNDMSQPYYQSSVYKEGEAAKHAVIAGGIPIDSVAMNIFSAIEDEQFYILTHPIYNPIIGMRVKKVLDGKNPSIKDFMK